MGLEYETREEQAKAAKIARETGEVEAVDDETEDEDAK